MAQPQTSSTAETTPEPMGVREAFDLAQRALYAVAEASTDPATAARQRDAISKLDDMRVAIAILPDLHEQMGQRIDRLGM